MHLDLANAHIKFEICEDLEGRSKIKYGECFVAGFRSWLYRRLLVETDKQFIG